MYHTSIDEMFKAAIGDCLFSGEYLASRDGGCLEVLGWSGTLVHPTQSFMWNPVRKFSQSYAAGELFWYLSGSADGDHIMHYAPSYKRFLEPDGKANGAYGARWEEHGGIYRLAQLLEQDPNTRQGVLAMWGPRDLVSAHQHDKKDIPCTLSLQYFVRNKALYCVCTMRSNDVWLGLPNDVFCFAQLQCLLADYLGLGIGWYCHQVGSMHLYDRNAEKAREALDTEVPSKTAPGIFPPETFGSFVFKSAIENAITLERMHREDVEKFFRCVPSPRTRLQVLLALSACTSIRRQASVAPSSLAAALGKDIMEVV